MSSTLRFADFSRGQGIAASHVVSEISPLLYETLPEAALDAPVRATRATGFQSSAGSSPGKAFTPRPGISGLQGQYRLAAKFARTDNAQNHAQGYGQHQAVLPGRAALTGATGFQPSAGR
ncbi:hypothetical protein AM504_06500 [Klebsiella michiganensis]|nr:hypothetical protein KONIH1_07675 [Klebsiella oxytoca KONIH1]KLU47466.1 hypothetical protein ABE84_13955 [Klebsiella michiganensis]